MLRSMLMALAFAGTLLAFAWLGAVGEPIARAGLAVALGVLVSAIAYGRATFLSVGVGALSPLAFSLVEKHSLGWAAALLCAIWLLPRVVLAETRRSAGLVACLSIVASIVAGFVFAAYVDAGWAAQIASCLFAGSCLSLVGLVPLDTPIGFALRTAAAAVDPPARDALERAAREHRHAASKRSQWRALLALADERAVLQRRNADASARKELDERIAALAEELAAPNATPPATEPPATEAPTSPEPTAVEVSLDDHGPDPAEIAAE
jgi:hypothetical protein